MIRWTSVIVLFSSMAAPILAQVSKPADPPPGSAESSAPTTAAPSATMYPLDAFQNFSAVMIGSRAEPGEGISRGHIYRSRNRMRMEEPGGRAYFITDLKVGETYGMLETGCIQDDHPYIRAIPFQMAANTGVTVARAPAGKETVDGHSCQIEDVTVSSSMFPNPQKMRFWEAEDLQGFPIKIEFLLPGGHGPIVRYKEIVLDPQDPTLFFHPKSCQPLPREQTASPGHKKLGSH